jgi:hypothetical protein
MSTTTTRFAGGSAIGFGSPLAAPAIAARQLGRTSARLSRSLLRAGNMGAIL